MLKGQKQVQADEAKRLHEIMKLDCMKGRRGLAIDGGAHVGSWTKVMTEYFEEVLAFEPCDKSYSFLYDNLGDNENVFLMPCALMDKSGNVSVHPPRKGKRLSLTARQVTPNRDGDVAAVSIDDLDVDNCSLIKLDLEGAEHLALLGAIKTIDKYKPLLIVEFNEKLEPRFGYTHANTFKLLDTLGYKRVWRNDVDFAFAHKDSI